MIEEEKDELNLSQARLAEKAVPFGQQPVDGGYENRVRHVYLEEENSYGRYVPFLLLKDKLHSQIDTSGTSALSHMCSHNSPYLPLYLSTLKQGDPILNRATNLGHTPMDIAGMYCRREYVDLLREKGAIDDGKVDSWAIQGANIANWSGKVDPSKKQLIHWAAFNNFPEVLLKFYEAGANVNEIDEKGNTPIDMAVVNKCYQSVQALAKLGYRCKPDLLQKCESPYLQNFIKELDRSSTSIFIEQTLKLSFVMVILMLQFLFAGLNVYLLAVTMALFVFLSAKVPGADSTTRPTVFYSSILNRDIIYGYNHLGYVLLMALLVFGGLSSIISMEIDSLWMGLYFWVSLGITLTFLVNLCLLVYGVMTNTTPNEMFESHRHPQLWKKIDYLPHSNYVMRVYKNLNQKDAISNLKAYFNYQP